MTELCDIGVIGLAVMGANLARNAARKGFGVALYNRHGARTDALVRSSATRAASRRRRISGFVASLAKPRAMIIMVKAGKPVDDVIAELVPHLEEGDIVIDGGNSLFSDSDRRYRALKDKGLRFIGMGVSGGEEGALLGPSMMPGGEREAYDRIAPMVTKMAAQVDGEPCAPTSAPAARATTSRWCTTASNMPTCSSSPRPTTCSRRSTASTPPPSPTIFEGWKSSDLDSYLIDITTEVLKKRDAKTGGALVDSIVDEAEQKGTGRWTAANALDLGVPLTGITEAVFARALSGRRKLRGEAEKLLPFQAPAGRKAARGRHRRRARRALRLQDHRLRAGLRADDGGLEGIWLGPEARRRRHHLARRLHHPGALPQPHPRRLRRRARPPEPRAGGLFPRRGAQGRARVAAVVVLAVEHGVAIPAFSSSLAYYDGLRRARGPANLLQGLRDYFGAHTYRRLDAEGAFHTRWSQDGSEMRTDEPSQGGTPRS